MDLLIDTHLVLDAVLNRPRSDVAKKMFNKARETGDAAFVSASAVTDMYYIIYKKLHNVAEAYGALASAFTLVNVLPVTEEDIMMAFYAHWQDFEDCVQFMAARRSRMDYIITRNQKDFVESSVRVLSPEEYLAS